MKEKDLSDKSVSQRVKLSLVRFIVSQKFLYGRPEIRLDKNDSITKDTNEYLYPLNDIAVLGNGGRPIPQDLSKGPLSLNVVVGESNNKVEKIVIFFK